MIPASVRLFIICVILSLTSCASFPRPLPEESRKADYGYYPDDYEKIFKAYVSTILFEPSTAEFSYVKGPIKTWIYQHTYYQYGWGVCYLINTKNYKGGNMAIYLSFALIYNGEVVDFELDRGDPTSFEMAHFLCSQLY